MSSSDKQEDADQSGQQKADPNDNDGQTKSDPKDASPDGDQKDKTYSSAVAQEDNDPVTHRSWADDTSSGDDEVTGLLSTTIRTKRDANIIKIPGDMEEVWPVGYRVMSEVSEKHRLTLEKDKAVTFTSGGFIDRAAFGKDSDQYIGSLNDVSKTNFITLVNLVYYTKLRPTYVAAREQKFALSACFALSFILKDRYDNNDLFKKSLKHPDGGKELVLERIIDRFQTNSKPALMLLQSCERLYRLNAKMLLRDSDLSKETIKDINLVCFTTRQGLLSGFMKRETRKENRLQIVTTKRGAKKQEKVEVLVHGFIVPNLPVSDDTLKSEEKEILRNNISFNDRIGILNEIVDEFNDNDHPLHPALVAKLTVETSYEMLNVIHDVTRQRKNMIRELAHKANNHTKITPADWLVHAKKVIEEDSVSDFNNLTRERLKSNVRSKLQSGAYKIFNSGNEVEISKET